MCTPSFVGAPQASLPIDPDLQVRLADPVLPKLTQPHARGLSIQQAGLTRVAGKICFSPVTSRGSGSRLHNQESPLSSQQASGITFAGQLQPLESAATPQFGLMVGLCFTDSLPPQQARSREGMNTVHC